MINSAIWWIVSESWVVDETKPILCSRDSESTIYSHRTTKPTLSSLLFALIEREQVVELLLRVALSKGTISGNNKSWTGKWRLMGSIDAELTMCWYDQFSDLVNWASNWSSQQINQTSKHESH